MQILKAMMEAQIDPMFNESDLEYRLYLQDHRPQILASCEKKIITTNEMAVYEYRPKEFLYANNFPVAAWWVVLWINNINGQHHFFKLKEILLPSLSLIEDLYQQYRTLRSQWNNAKKKISNV